MLGYLASLAKNLEGRDAYCGMLPAECPVTISGHSSRRCSVPRYPVRVDTGHTIATIRYGLCRMRVPRDSLYNRGTGYVWLPGPGAVQYFINLIIQNIFLAPLHFTKHNVYFKCAAPSVDLSRRPSVKSYHFTTRVAHLVFDS